MSLGLIDVALDAIQQTMAAQMEGAACDRRVEGETYGRATTPPEAPPCDGGSPRRSQGNMFSLIGAALQRRIADSPTRVVLRDGRPLAIRPLAPGDRPAVAALLAGLSPESRAQRFQSAAVALTPATLDMVTAGHVLVADLGGRLVALGSYIVQPEATQAEPAFAVADAEQGRGIGTALAACLAHDARRAGVRQFQAEVLGSNWRALRLLHRLGCGVTSTRTSGALTVYVELCPNP